MEWNTKNYLITTKHGNEETKEGGQIKMVDLNPTISVIRWTVNGLNTTIKRQRLSGREKQNNTATKTQIYAVQRRDT